MNSSVKKYKGIKQVKYGLSYRDYQEKLPYDQFENTRSRQYQNLDTSSKNGS